VKPADDATSSQRTESRKGSRRSDSNALRQPLIGDPGVAGEDLEDRPIEVVHVWMWNLWHPGHRKASNRIIYDVTLS
jgi:hypothetical protein